MSHKENGQHQYTLVLFLLCFVPEVVIEKNVFFSAYGRDFAGVYFAELNNSALDGIHSIHLL